MTRRIRRTLVLPVLVLAVLVLPAAGCGGEQPGDDAGRTGDTTRQRVGQARADLPPVLAARLDSGNSAYREGDYRRALELYRSATEEDAEVAAPWFGVYMAYSALGEEDSARAALERAGGLSESGGGFHGSAGGDSGVSGPNPSDTRR